MYWPLIQTSLVHHSKERQNTLSQLQNSHHYLGYWTGLFLHSVAQIKTSLQLVTSLFVNVVDMLYLKLNSGKN